MVRRTGGDLKITERTTSDYGPSTTQKEGPALALGVPLKLGPTLLRYGTTQMLGLLGAHVHGLGERSAGLERRRQGVRRPGDGAVEEQRELPERDFVAALESLPRRKTLPVEEGAVDRPEIPDRPTAVRAKTDLSLAARDGGVVDHQLHVLRAPDVDDR